MAISLEDGYIDVINKAQRGLNVSDNELAEKTGIALDLLSEIKSGQINPEALRAIAPVLQLNSAALIRLAEGDYHPAVTPPKGFAAFNSPFEDYTVNSYLAWDVETREAVVFDTGSDATELLHTIVQNDFRVSHILLTHTHSDHVFDLDRVAEKTHAPYYTTKLEPVEGAVVFESGAIFRIGSLTIETLLTNGHSPGGITYVVHGLATPVAIVGDSIFAGSMGGAANVWQLAVGNNRDKILSLPPETLIAPGHGPLSTVGLELANNPFFA